METGITNEFQDTSSGSSTGDQGSSGVFVLLMICRVILALALSASSPFVELPTGDWIWKSYEPSFTE
jgi:hypothetical protein